MGQYFPGERRISPKDLPGLSWQLNNSRSDLQKADVLLSLGFGYLYKRGAEKADMDSAAYCAREAISLSTHIKHPSFINEAFLLRSIISMEAQDEAAAKEMLHKMNDSTKVKLLYCLSRHYFYGGANIDSSVHYARTAIKLASKIRFWGVLMEAWLQEVVGKIYVPKDLLSEAEKQYLFMMEHGRNLSKIFYLTQLSHIFLVRGDFHKALSYGMNAEKALSSNSPDQDFFRVYHGLGNAYRLQKKYEKALYYHGKILANPGKYNISAGIYHMAYNYFACLQNLNRTNEIFPYLQKLHQQYPPKNEDDKSYYYLILASTYRQMGKFEPAEENYLEAIKCANSAKQPVSRLYSYLGSLYVKFNRLDKAVIALKTSEKNATEESDMLASTFTNMSNAEAALGNYENAYKYLFKSRAITDSIYTVSKEKHTQELEFQYQTQKKEADLRLKEENIRYLNQQAQLLEQEGKLQQAKLSEASLLTAQKEAALQLREKDIEILKNSSKLQQEKAESKRKITILVIVLLAVIIALLCWLFWTKLRSNKIITHKNVQLQQLLTDKSWLLKEMHHRVKNNLHTVMSLLESQSAYLENDALEAVKNSQSRIFSMSLIHQKLYQSEDVRTINMAFYIPELIAYLRECFNLQNNFHIRMDIDHVEFDVTEAVPLGLIVNEAVTNSLKYAFKNKQHGEINISLKATGEKDFELIMTDNGMGLKEEFDMNNITSLGFKLIKGLSAQLEAQLRITNENGLKITLSGIIPYRREFNQQLTA